MSNSNYIIQIRPLNLIELFLDFIMIPVMYFVSGVWLKPFPFGRLFEVPQRTHHWNNCHIKDKDCKHKVIVGMGHTDFGDERSFSKFALALLRTPVVGKIFGPILFHIPILGGWKTYLVFRPTEEFDARRPWYIGWMNDHVFGVTRVPSIGPVRVLQGRDPVLFWAIDHHGYQIPLEQIGIGKVGGNHPEFKRLPLL